MAVSDFALNLAAKVAKVSNVPVDVMALAACLNETTDWLLCDLGESQANAGRLEIAIQDAAESICDAIESLANRMCNVTERDPLDDLNECTGSPYGREGHFNADGGE